ncbi:MAG: hypothetical protein JW938_00005, partial [Candidatus Omnitrophica bacterium]|nr:hypothetical protein [Candidatus Omnitrophota bacterium]
MVHTRMIKKFIVPVVTIVTIMICAVCGGIRSAEAASVILDKTIVPLAQQDFSLTLRLDVLPSENIASFDITVEYDASRMILNAIEPTLHLQASGKTLDWNENQIGRVRIVVYGMNANPITTGSVLTLRCAKVSGVPIGPVSVTLSELRGTSGSVLPIPLSIVNHAVSYDGPPPEIPTILNTETMINKDQFTLRWTDESTSGAAEYLVTRMENVVTPLEFTDGLVSYWKLDESRGVAYDVFGANTLVDVNSVPGTNDKPFDMIPGSRIFSYGTGGHLSIDDSAQTGLAFGAAMTWSAWVKPSAIRKQMTILRKCNINNSFYEWIITERGELQVAISEDGQTGSVSTSTSNVITPNVWQHIALSYEKGGVHSDPFSETTGRHTVSSFGNVTINENDWIVGPSIRINDKQSGLLIPASNDFDFGSQ